MRPCQRVFIELFRGFLECLQAVSVAVFTIEYGARLYSIVEDKQYADETWWRGRLRYATTFTALVDLAAM